MAIVNRADLSDEAYADHLHMKDALWMGRASDRELRCAGVYETTTVGQLARAELARREALEA